MENTTGSNILTIDIGGSHVKATILNANGETISDYKRLPTPQPSSPENILSTIGELVKDLPEYNKISVGFPGYVRDGVVKTAPNLGTDYWKDFDLSKKLETELGKPTRVVNDADMQGLGVVSGKGLEMMITLGTGFGTALLVDGQLMPHLELAHHPFAKGKTYDDYVGDRGLEKEGLQKWNKRMRKVLKVLKWAKISPWARPRLPK